MRLAPASLQSSMQRPRQSAGSSLFRTGRSWLHQAGLAAFGIAAAILCELTREADEAAAALTELNRLLAGLGSEEALIRHDWRLSAGCQMRGIPRQIGICKVAPPWQRTRGLTAE